MYLYYTGFFDSFEIKDINSVFKLMVKESQKNIWKPFFLFINTFVHPNKVGIDYKIIENFMYSFNNWFNLIK